MNQVKVKSEQQKLIDTVSYMDEAQSLFIHNMIRMVNRGSLNKGDLMDQADMLGTGKVDSALPTPFVNRVQEVLPSFKTSFYVMDYRKESFGEVNNVAEAIILKLQEVFQE